MAIKLKKTYPITFWLLFADIAVILISKFFLTKLQPLISVLDFV